MNVTIQNAAKRIAALDASPFIQHIDDAHAEIKRLEAGVEMAFEREAAIRATLSDVRDHSLLRSNAGNDIADKLLEGDLVAVARPDTKLLEEELDLLKQGVRELKCRIQDQRQIILAAQSAMKQAVGAELLTLADEYEVAAKDAAGLLIEIYAASFALVRVAPNNALANLQRKLSPAIAAMCNSNNQIAPQSEGLNVPSTLGPILDAIRKFDLTLANSVPSTVSVPRD